MAMPHSKPVAPRAASAKPRTADDMPAGDAPAAGDVERPRILVADDEPQLLVLFREILAPAGEADLPDFDRELAAVLSGRESPAAEPGYELTTCRQAAEAVEAVRQGVETGRPYAAAFLDVRMPPGPDGVWAAERIRAMDPYVQIVIITAFSDIDPRSIAARVPPTDRLLYLQKPFHPQEIRQFANSLCAKWRAERDFMGLNARLGALVEERTAELTATNRRLKREIEERVKVASLIEAAKREWEGTFDSVQDLVVILDRQSRVRRLNMAMAHRLGLNPKDVVGKPCVFLFDRPEAPKERSGQVLSMADGRFHSKEIAIPRLRGEFLITAAPIQGQDESQSGTVFVAHDVTDRKGLERRLRQSQKMEAIGTLAGGIAHDFNNILGIIMGFSEMILDAAAQGSDTARRVEHILKACHRARDLVRQILTFSRQTDQELKPLRLIPMVKETLKLIRATLGPNIRIIENYPAKSDTVKADPTQMQQIVMNLCANAAHAMGEAGGDLTVSIEDVVIQSAAAWRGEPEPGRYARLAVSDTGHGIPKDILDRVFDPFFTTKKPGEGTGMGLSVVHGIVQKHGGEIKVKSEPGRGTTFEVCLPLCAETAEDGTEAVGPFTAKGRGRILFVDDESSLAEIGREMLESLGYSVLAETDPAAALTRFRADPGSFDAVVTDQHMPGLSGATLAAELLAARPGLPIVLCTGFSETMSREKAREQGIREFLLKPLLKKDLAEALDRAMRGSIGPDGSALGV